MRKILLFTASLALIMLGGVSSAQAGSDAPPQQRPVDRQRSAPGKDLGSGAGQQLADDQAIHLIVFSHQYFELA